MIPFAAIALGASGSALAAGTAVFAGARICRNVQPFDDGPRPGKPPARLLIASSAIIGGALAERGFPPIVILECAILLWAFAGSCYCDIRCGIVPDVFTLAPLVAVLALGVLFAHTITPIVSASIVVLPFGVLAGVSRGRGIGWGDVKLVGLGGAVLGLTHAVLALGAACLVAVAVAVVRRRRSEPIAFAPYLVGSMSVVLLSATP